MWHVGQEARKKNDTIDLNPSDKNNTLENYFNLNWSNIINLQYNQLIMSLRSIHTQTQW